MGFLSILSDSFSLFWLTQNFSNMRTEKWKCVTGTSQLCSWNSIITLNYWTPICFPYSNFDILVCTMYMYITYCNHNTPQNHVKVKIVPRNHEHKPPFADFINPCHHFWFYSGLICSILVRKLAGLSFSILGHRFHWMSCIYAFVLCCKWVKF